MAKPLFFMRATDPTPAEVEAARASNGVASPLELYADAACSSAPLARHESFAAARAAANEAGHELVFAPLAPLPPAAEHPALAAALEASRREGAELHRRAERARAAFLKAAFTCACGGTLRQVVKTMPAGVPFVPDMVCDACKREGPRAELVARSPEPAAPTLPSGPLPNEDKAG